MMAKKNAAAASGAGAQYHRLTRSGQQDFVDLQFERQPVKVPYKAILLAVALFLVGSLLIIVGALLLSGYIDSKYSDRTWPVLIIGALMFIPGAYHVRLACYAYKGYTGFSYEDIPEFD